MLLLRRARAGRAGVWRRQRRRSVRGAAGGARGAPWRGTRVRRVPQPNAGLRRTGALPSWPACAAARAALRREARRGCATSAAAAAACGGARPRRAPPESVLPPALSWEPSKLGSELTSVPARLWRPGALTCCRGRYETPPRLDRPRCCDVGERYVLSYPVADLRRRQRAERRGGRAIGAGRATAARPVPPRLVLLLLMMMLLLLSSFAASCSTEGCGASTDCARHRHGGRSKHW